MANKNRRGKKQTVQERDDTVFLNGNRDDAPRYILVCPMWNRILLVLGCCLGICSGACLLALRQPADLSRYLLLTLGIGIPVMFAFLVKLKGRRLHLRGRENTGVSGEIREGADEYITVCPMILSDQILLVLASFASTFAGAAVAVLSEERKMMEHFLGLLLVFIPPVGMLMMVTSVKLRRQQYYFLAVKRIFSLMKMVSVGVLARAIISGLPGGITGGMGYFVVVEARPKLKRKLLWGIHLCLHILSFIYPEEIILPGNIFFYELASALELVTRWIDDYCVEEEDVASVVNLGRRVLDLFITLFILLPISVCVCGYMSQMRIFQQMGVDVLFEALAEEALGMCCWLLRMVNSQKR
jgi:hypothetical protein